MTAERAVEIPEPVGSKQVPTRTPECLITLGFEAGAGQQYLGPAPHVKGEVLDAFHERRSLDEEQGVMVICSGGAQKGPGTGESIGHPEAEPHIESLRQGYVRNEQHDMGKSPG